MPKHNDIDRTGPPSRPPHSEPVPRARSFAPNTVLGSDIRLIAPMGRGGMGTVWRGQHVRLGRDVAVKFLASTRADDDAIERFRREACLAASIESVHVAHIYDLGVAYGDTPYIVMELLKGENLADRLDRDLRLDIPTTAKLIAQVGSALRRAHAINIVHRDVKPSNVFLVDTEEDLFVKLLDFGVAKRRDDAVSLTGHGALLGTLPYMSPEQLVDSKQADQRADIWALGVVAYECITGTRPFRGGAALLPSVILDGQYEAASEAASHVPPAVDEWFARSLSVDLSKRFQSVAEQISALRDATAGAPATLSDIPTLRPTDHDIDDTDVENW